MATELKRSGASSPATASFLVATPETGVDSVSVSYALLGPIFAIYRPVTAILSAIITGLLVATTGEQRSTKKTAVKTSCCATEKAKVVEASSSSYCASKRVEQAAEKNSSCCAGEKQPSATVLSKTGLGLKYAATKLIDDLIIWLFIGLLFATLIKTFVPQEFLLSYGTGLPAMLMMIAISIPMYICATASTPIAAGLIMAGISPGTALVFMMAGPATNISTLGVIKNEMGAPVLLRYLTGIAACAIAFGLLLDWALVFFAIDISQQMSHNHSMLPDWFGLSCAVLIALLAIKPLRKQFISA